MTIGVLALQGDFASHEKILRECGVDSVAVRDQSTLMACDGLIIPGGESTTMSRLCDRYGLWQPLRERLEQGMPAFGTCAGLIMLSRSIEGGAQTFAQNTLGTLDIDVARNAYGRQLDSFESDVEVPALREAGLGDDALRAIFIRAPRIARIGEGVEVLASHAGEAVAVRSGNCFGAAFHPEIAGDNRLHLLWLRVAAENG
jgi:5'-phosphate synthase pdxT subunit